MHELPRQTLRDLVRTHGLSIIEEPVRCKGMLKDLCGEYRREISGILIALEEAVPTQLLHPPVSVEMLRTQLSQKLQDDRGLATDVAIWSVDAWAFALDLITETQLRPVSHPISTPFLPTHPPDASIAAFNPSQLMPLSFTTLTLDDQGKTISRQNHHNHCFIEEIGNGVQLEMMFVPPGIFWMGSTETEPHHTSFEDPRHQVVVSDFWMGRYPITQAQYLAITGVNPSSFKDPTPSNLPVENITWLEAKHFCDQLSQITGRHYRLPSEAEWEYACRAGTTTPFHFGATITPDVANYNGKSIYNAGPQGQYLKKTVPVGSFTYGVNAFGLFDLHGNVAEWCEDVWQSNYQGTPVDGRAWTASGNSEVRVIRGGSWHQGSWHCRSAARGSKIFNQRSSTIGFRVVLTP